jgi:hypothetical protein
MGEDGYMHDGVEFEMDEFNSVIIHEIPEIWKLEGQTYAKKMRKDYNLVDIRNVEGFFA